MTNGVKRSSVQVTTIKPKKLSPLSPCNRILLKKGSMFVIQNSKVTRVVGVTSRVTLQRLQFLNILLYFSNFNI